MDNDYLLIYNDLYHRVKQISHDIHRFGSLNLINSNEIDERNYIYDWYTINYPLFTWKEYVSL